MASQAAKLALGTLQQEGFHADLLEGLTRANPPAGGLGRQHNTRGARKAPQREGNPGEDGHRLFAGQQQPVQLHQGLAHMAVQNGVEHLPGGLRPPGAHELAGLLGRDLCPGTGHQGQLGEFLVQQTQLRPDHLDQRVRCGGRELDVVGLPGPGGEPAAELRRGQRAAIDRQTVGRHGLGQPRIGGP